MNDTEGCWPHQWVMQTQDHHWARSVCCPASLVRMMTREKAWTENTSVFFRPLVSIANVRWWQSSLNFCIQALPVRRGSIPAVTSLDTAAQRPCSLYWASVSTSLRCVLWITENVFFQKKVLATRLWHWLCAFCGATGRKGQSPVVSDLIVVLGNICAGHVFSKEMS